MEKEHIDIVLQVIYVVSCGGVALGTLYWLSGCNGLALENANFPKMDSVVFVGTAGFSVFPVINTFICIFFIYYLTAVVLGVKKKQIEAERNSREFMDNSMKILFNENEGYPIEKIPEKK